MLWQMNSQLPEDITQCIICILNERHVQATHNGRELVGTNALIIFDELSKRLGPERAEIWRREIKRR